MEFILVVLGIAYLVLPFFGFVAWWRSRNLRAEVDDLRDRLADLRIQLKETHGTAAPRPAFSTGSPSPVEAAPVPPAAPAPPTPPVPAPAPAPVRLRWDEEPATPFEPVEPAERSAPEVPPPIPSAAAPEPYDWMGLLRRLHLLPPEKDWTEAGLAAWWTTRVGILLGIIAAVFFAVYISHQSPAWVRWLELLGVAVGLSYWGYRMTRPRDAGGETLRGYGEVVLGGGLALLYFTAFAGHALEPVRVVADPRAGIVLQVAAALIFFGLAWAARLRVAGTFSILGGLVSLGFAQYHGFHGFALVASVLLAAAGPGLLLGRGWMLPALISLPGVYALTAALAASGNPPLPLLFFLWLAVVWFIHVVAPWRGHARNAWPLDRKLDRLWTTVNSSGAIALAWFFSHQTGPAMWKPFTLAAGLIALTAAYGLRRRMPDPYFEGNYYLKGSFLLTAWLLLTLDGPARWVSLALQSAALLASWWREPGRMREFAFVVVWTAAFFWAAAALYGPLDAARPWWQLEAARHVFLAVALATAGLYLHRKARESAAAAESGPSWPLGGVLLAGLLAATTGGRRLPPDAAAALRIVTFGLLSAVAWRTRSRWTWSAPALVLAASAAVFLAGPPLYPSTGWAVSGLMHAAPWALAACLLHVRPPAGLADSYRSLGIRLATLAAVVLGVFGAGRQTGLDPLPLSALLAATWGVLAAALGFAISAAGAPDHRHRFPWWSVVAATAVLLLLFETGGVVIVPAIALAWMALAGFMATRTGSRESRAAWWIWGLGACGWLHAHLPAGRTAILIAAAFAGLWFAGAWRMSALGSASWSATAAWLLGAVSTVFVACQVLPAPWALASLTLAAAAAGTAGGRPSLRGLDWVWSLAPALAWLHFALPGHTAPLAEHGPAWWLAAAAGMALLAVARPAPGQTDVSLTLPWSQWWVAAAAALTWCHVTSWSPDPVWRAAVLAAGAALLAAAGFLFHSRPAGGLAMLVWIAAAVGAFLARDAALPALPFWTGAALVGLVGLGLGWALQRPFDGSLRPATAWLHALAAPGLLVLLAVSPGQGVDAYATVLWAAAGIVTLAAGFAARLKPYRLTGLGILALCILRLFAHDLDSTFHRIIASAALAVLLVVTGFFYSRFRRWLE